MEPVPDHVSSTPEPVREAEPTLERELRLGAGLEEAEPEEVDESRDPPHEHDQNARSQKGAEQAVTRYLLPRPQCHDPASVLSPVLSDGKAHYPRRDRRAPGLRHARTARATHAF